MKNLRNYRLEVSVSADSMASSEEMTYIMERKRNELLQAVRNEMPICAGCSEMKLVTIGSQSTFGKSTIRPVCNDPHRLCSADDKFMSVAGDYRGVDGSATTTHTYGGLSEYAEINPKVLNDFFERTKNIQNDASWTPVTIVKPIRSPDVPSVNEDFW